MGLAMCYDSEAGALARSGLFAHHGHHPFARQSSVMSNLKLTDAEARDFEFYSRKGLAPHQVKMQMSLNAIVRDAKRRVANR
jgi:hypothetical protein